MIPYNQLMQLYQSSLYGGLDPLSYATAQNYQIANANNEARYGDILQGLTGIYDRNMDRITSLGDQERADINRRADQNKAAQVSDAISRGYGASTVKNSIQNRAEEDRTRALAQFRDQETMRQINTDSQLAGNVFNFMERRSDVQPNMQNLTNANLALGAAGGGYGPIINGRPVGAPTAGRISPMGAGMGGGTLPRPGIGNMGPGSGGAPGGPSYALPGGQMSTPLRQPMSAYGQYGAPVGNARIQNALERQLLQQLESKPTYNTNNSSKPFIRATGDLGGSLPTYNRAPWQNQDISFGGPSVGGAYMVPGNPIPLGNYNSTSYGYGGATRGNYGPRPSRTTRPSGVQIQRPSGRPNYSSQVGQYANQAGQALAGLSNMIPGVASAIGSYLGNLPSSPPLAATGPSSVPQGTGIYPFAGYNLNAYAGR